MARKRKSGGRAAAAVQQGMPEEEYESLPQPLAGAPPEPQPSGGPAIDWPHHKLWTRVRTLLESLPSYFESDLKIVGVLATDLFAFNSSLGATIEEQVVRSLNRLRDHWDVDKKYAAYSFVRRSQRFPDVTLQKPDAEDQDGILFGIELKGWYALAKERQPSFRFQATPAVCAPADLIAIYPWALSEVVSGTPRLFKPFIAEARYAAEYRNWHWKWKRKIRAKKDGAMPSRDIDLSSVEAPYPSVKADQISDKPHSDKDNFGRIARTGITGKYIEGDNGVGGLMRSTLTGIPLWAWQEFMKPFAETAAEATLRAAIIEVAQRVADGRAPSREEVALAVDYFRTFFAEFSDSFNE